MDADQTLAIVLTDDAVRAAVAEAESTMARIDCTLMQVPNDPLSSPFGPETVSIETMVRSVVTAYLAAAGNDSNREAGA